MSMKMSVEVLLEHLMRAQALIGKYGLVDRDDEDKRGLTTGVALALTGLPNDLADKVAAFVSRPGKRLFGLVEDLDEATSHYGRKHGFDFDRDNLTDIIAKLKVLK